MSQNVRLLVNGFLKSLCEIESTGKNKENVNAYSFPTTPTTNEIIVLLVGLGADRGAKLKIQI
jgi:hypothetical protein